MAAPVQVEVLGLEVVQVVVFLVNQLVLLRMPIPVALAT